MRFGLVPLPLDEANIFVREHHRHHGPVHGHKFAIGIADADGVIRGVVIVGRPVTRALDNGMTLEVTRLATDGCKDACSALYGAARRATFALGYKKLVTYILASESGTSLVASGWKCLGEIKGKPWNMPGRPRIDKHPLQNKLRWEVVAETGVSA